MKKIFALLTIVAIAGTMSVSAAQTKTGAFFDKLNQKEQELNQKIDAHQKARESQKAEIAKKQAEQQKAAEAKKAEIAKKQAAQKAALEKAKKDAEARSAANKKAIEAEKTYWKNLLNK